MIIATLIAADRLVRESIEEACRLVAGAGWRWIDEGSAADIEIGDPKLGIAEARALLGGRFAETDVVVQLAGHRRKRMLVADMDSTMIGQECIDELADYAGVKDRVAAVTERAMQGELDFEQALRERVALLRGLEAQAIERCLAERVRANPGAKTLVRTMRARGCATLLVSGGFTAFAEPVAEGIGFEHVQANRLAVEGGILAGTVDGTIVDSRAKRAALIALRDGLGFERHEVLAIGDGANDRPMIEEAGLGVAYRAKPVLADAADARLDHDGLDSLLWAQGIARAEWVSG